MIIFKGPHVDLRPTWKSMLGYKLKKVDIKLSVGLGNDAKASVFAAQENGAFVCKTFSIQPQWKAVWLSACQ